MTSASRQAGTLSRKLIVCADDFGLDVAVNEAVENAARDGILTCASLMVGEAACGDAVTRARELGGKLGVGLHVTLTSGRAVLPASVIPDLVDAEGNFSTHLARVGAKAFFVPSVRRQMADEIRAQFEAFQATGLALDHVNAHQHYHLHPVVVGLILDIGRDYGLTAMRITSEPASVLRKAADGEKIGALPYQPWIWALKRRLRRSGVFVNDHLFGLRWTGAMTSRRIGRLLPHLPNGVSELYFHPAVHSTALLERAAPGYRHVDEYQALMDPSHRSVIDRESIRLTTYGELSRGVR